VAVGGGLRDYTVAGEPVLDGYPEGEMCHAGRGQVLAPWPNRLDGGRYRFGGTDLQLPIDEVGRANAIHGLVRWSSWNLEQPGPSRVVAAHVLYPRPGYPFTLGLRVEYELDSRGLSATTTASNLGPDPLPFGVGFHPYLTVRTEQIDDAVLTLPAGRVLVADDRGVPTGVTSEVTGSDRDFRNARRMGDVRMDDCYTDLRRDEEDCVRVTLTAPGGTPAVDLWADAQFGYLMLFTGDTLPAPERRRGLAIEPMTCPPNAFVSGEGLVVLEPGEQRRYRWGISPRPVRSGAARDNPGPC
jgi:aldose 1-epimerase